MSGFESDNPYIEYQDPSTAEEYEVSTLDLILFSTRIATCILFLFCTFSVLVCGLLLQKYIKNWKLCIVASGALAAWLGLSLYSDHVDVYWAGGFIAHYHQRSYIFHWFLNFFHGLTLFLTLLLLGHLADFQKRGCWLLLVIVAIFVPIAYSVVIILVDLYAKERFLGGKWSAFVVLFRTGIYNILNLIFLLGFAPRFCTSRLYGTYDEKRSPSVILISRWIFMFLLLHNLVEIAWGVIMAIRLASDEVIFDSTFILMQGIFNEVKFVLIVFAIPMSYAISILIRACCSREEEAKNLELDNIDKIYEEVWRPEAKRPYDLHGGGSEASSINDSGVVDFIIRDPNPRKTDRKKRDSYLEALSNGSMEEHEGSISVTSQPIDL